MPGSKQQQQHRARTVNKAVMFEETVEQTHKNAVLISSKAKKEKKITEKKIKVASCEGCE